MVGELVKGQGGGGLTGLYKTGVGKYSGEWAGCGNRLGL